MTVASNGDEKTWDEQIANIDWAPLRAHGNCPEVLLDVLTTVPRTWRLEDTLALMKFGMN